MALDASSSVAARGKSTDQRSLHGASTSTFLSGMGTAVTAARRAATSARIVVRTRKNIETIVIASTCATL